jgi:sugar O-acyltransferase (sialic acid O-acetyltransferase NeuD family)
VRLTVIGAGGHAKVVIDAALAAGHEVVRAIGASDGAATLLGVPVLPEGSSVEGDGFIVAVGDNARRAELFSRYTGDGFAALSVVHPSAIVARDVVVGAGSVIAAGAVVNTQTVIGANAIVNTGCTIDHDCVVGDHALVGPGASVCGVCRIGEGALVGAGASVIPVKTIGAWSVIGAGAAVVTDVPDRAVYVGVPARPARTPR